MQRVILPIVDVIFFLLLVFSHGFVSGTFHFVEPDLVIQFPGDPMNGNPTYIGLSTDDPVFYDDSNDSHPDSSSDWDSESDSDDEGHPLLFTAAPRPSLRRQFMREVIWRASFFSISLTA